MPVIAKETFRVFRLRKIRGRDFVPAPNFFMNVGTYSGSV
jgi:hypothetical protein